ncbi:MAG: isoprenylcysteine carboxylmethyltransferase family protein [Anaerolineales bacterium]|nr:isoprenylcysteine carboxylmethyltransferase family protein [Anaerolineales bacterium]
MKLLKSVLFLVLVPGLLIGYFPYWPSITDVEVFATGSFRYLAIPLWVASSVGMLWCFWNFLVNGRGTPAPIDPPKELVAVGLYRYVRNPMYVAGLTGLFGWILWSPSLPLIVAPLIFFIATHLFITLYEESTLKKKFGATYESYLKQVPRWIPKFK